jgi:hypothetical protein
VPVTGWSREHGDIRVAHFIGLHAIQTLTLIALGLRRWRRPESVRVKAVLVASASYALLFLLLLWQALRGRSIVPAGPTAFAPIAAWALVSLLAIGWIFMTSPNTSHDGADRMAL